MAWNFAEEVAELVTFESSHRNWNARSVAEIERERSKKVRSVATVNRKASKPNAARSASRKVWASKDFKRFPKGFRKVPKDSKRLERSIHRRVIARLLCPRRAHYSIQSTVCKRECLIYGTESIETPFSFAICGSVQQILLELPKKIDE